MHFIFDSLNLSPILGIPPKIQYASFKFFNIFSEEAKLVDFESLIIVRFFLSNIICCLKSKPLNVLMVLINVVSVLGEISALHVER